MDVELADTLKLIVERYGNRSSGNVFIPLEEFPWYHEGNGQLTKLQEEGMISKVFYSDNGAQITLTKAGREYFIGVLFAASGAPMICPVCGMRARVICTDAARSWAEISCENCSTYAIKKDALIKTATSDLPILSGYYRHVRHEPMTVQCDSQETIREHVEKTRRIVTRDYQMKTLLRYYYHKMSEYEEMVQLENHPAIAYASDEQDLMTLSNEAVEKKYALIRNGAISVTAQGKEYLDMLNEPAVKSPKIFISHRGSDKAAATAFVDFLEDLGVDSTSIVCTSVPDTLIPNGVKIYDWLRSQFNNYELHVIFLLSKAYYESPDCLNEMGAAWVTKTKSDVILLPGFSPSDIRGCIGSDTMAISWDGPRDILEDRLNQLKQDVCTEFGLKQLADRRWSTKRVDLIEKVMKCTPREIDNKS